MAILPVGSSHHDGVSIGVSVGNGVGVSVGTSGVSTSSGVFGIEIGMDGMLTYYLKI
jgi:hypothetical protein